jgi:tRNA G18 (ribose-2'-O)-methylase SpoU
MGTLFWQPVVSTNFAEFEAWLRRNAYPVYSTSAHAALDYLKVKAYVRSCILLMGSEREGLALEQAAVCEYLLRLPNRKARSAAAR